MFELRHATKKLSLKSNFKRNKNKQYRDKFDDNNAISNSFYNRHESLRQFKSHDSIATIFHISLVHLRFLKFDNNFKSKNNQANNDVLKSIKNKNNLVVKKYDVV